MCKLDLIDAYLVVPINVDDQVYLRFRWNQMIYQFKSLPFGLSSAPRLFTKLLKPKVAVLRRLGVKLIIYLDDMLLMAETLEKLKQDRDSTLYLLQMLGFVINWEKSVLDPTQNIAVLGFDIDSANMRFILPDSKVVSIKQKSRKLLSANTISVREMAKLSGKLVSTVQAVIPAGLQCRYMQMSQVRGLMQYQSYDTMIPITKGVTKGVTKNCPGG